MKLVMDMEGNGLRDECTKIWCFIGYDIDNKDWYIYHNDSLSLVRKLLKNTTLLIGHNIIGYDLPVLKRLMNIDYNRGKCDTLILSKLLNPDRRSIEVPKKPHSIEAWGYRVGIKKLSDLNWSEWHPDLINRCKTDVEIGHKTYLKLMEESNGVL